MSTAARFSAEMLRIDAGDVALRLERAIRDIVRRDLRRKGAVVALSGGVDSSVVAALCARALGKDRVLGLFLPEADSSADSLRLGRLVAEQLGIRSVVEDITPILAAAGCYRRRDEAIRSVVPEYGAGYKCKLVLPELLGGPRYAVYSIVVESPSHVQTKARLTAEAYSQIVAATNFKQRTRKMMEYYYADLLGYAVAGTPNRLEYDQGFFVKNGDGAADFKPIAHLYKSEVYQLAAYLGIPEEIRQRNPTTDTYPLDQSQEEFYFSLPYDKMDLCLCGKNCGAPVEEVAAEANLSPAQVQRVYELIDSKRNATRYLHRQPVLVAPVQEV